MRFTGNFQEISRMYYLFLSFFQGQYQLAITTEEMIPDIVNHLNSPNLDLKLQCSSAIFKCGVDRTVRRMVREANGLEPLVAITKDKAIRENKPLLAAATGAIWKCAASDKNVKQLDNVIFPLVVFR